MDAPVGLGGCTETKPIVCERGDHLVGVHVGAGATAGLIDVDREVLVVLAFGHVVCRRDNHFGEPPIELAKVFVRLGTRGLQVAERVDHGRRQRAVGDRESFPPPARSLAPYRASIGTCISPIVSRSIRLTVIVSSHKPGR